MEAKKRKSLKISESLHWRVKSQASAHHLSLEEWVEMVLEDALPVQKPTKRKK
jgi:predicted HicB family RNase H-like nuclease